MNQNPKQFARDITDADHLRCGRAIQDKIQINFNVVAGVAGRKNQTFTGQAVCALLAPGNLLCFFHWLSLKETMQTGAFPISSIMFLQKPYKMNL